MVLNSMIMCLLVANVQLSSQLRITSFYVPRRAYNQVEMDCKYDVEDRRLYDVKWYKDDLQFLRCTADGAVQDFPVDGLETRHSKFASIGRCPFTLIVLTPKSSGVYRCEVSLEAPDFQTVSRSSRMDFLEVKRTRGPPEQREANGSEKHISEEGNVCKDRSKTSKRYIFDRRNVQKRLAGLQDEYDILPPEEPSSQNRPSPSAAANKSAATGYRAFPVSTTYKNVTLPLKSSKLASPFPEPVKLMPSHTVSDQDKAAQMQAECRIPKFAVRK
ncbi:hypothetical protein NQ317_010627 [Molorchus minor]|uniref:Ig-like domain-containing protein n=1 Tax=Molorchus minor TaxID=1323400 RepID=A0ABQ9JCT5_9CUCU|nr:hypothetical protein NQ317_010627 [Molorchus minor]